MKGQRVYHLRYGYGEAQFSRKAGVEWQVRFESRDVRFVRADELEFEDSARTGSAALPQFKPRPPHFAQRKVVEALRLGIVPDEGLSLFTLGREKEVAILQQWLAVANPHDSTRLVIGSYGSGKTHLLQYFRLRALEAGYAVSLVEMDPQETPFSKPKRVYAQIVRNLEWGDGGQVLGFRQLVERGLRIGMLGDHDYFRHMIHPRDVRLWDWIDGSGGSIRPISDSPECVGLPGLYDYMTAANIYCYLLSGLGALCRSGKLGLKGMLVLFDESEALCAARGSIARDRSVNFLDALIATARGDASLLQSAWRSEFDYAGHAGHIPFLYEQPSGLKLVFAFTSRDDLWISRELENQDYFSLDPLDVDPDILLSQLLTLYECAYPDRSGSLDKDTFLDLLEDRKFSSTRALVKSAVEALDICRFGTCDLENDY